MTVDVVLVGCGCPKRGMGWYHLTQLIEMPNVCMKAVVEPWYLGAGGSAPGAAEFMEMKAEYEAKGVSFYSSIEDMPMATGPTHVERRQGAVCEIAYAEKPGRCVYCGYPNAVVGCKTCGVRFCSGSHSNPPFECLNRHLSGEKCKHVPRKEVEWWVPDEEEE